MSGSERDSENHGRVALSICVTCRPAGWTGGDEERPGARLANAIEDAAEQGATKPITVRRIRCMSQCKRPCVVAFSGDDRFTYVFGDLDPAIDAATVLSCFDLYREKPDGYMDRWERPETMRDGLVGRIPPLGSTHRFVAHEREIEPGIETDTTISKAECSEA
ncbi:DUF1636 domain-containing protein [Terrarubrum flagellatum]|uniref:DUF1636 domain-containing protein n=1 Tax=Terrirubrum flagellatum TaxID=2895980 RepID=UPI00314534D1